MIYNQSFFFPSPCVLYNDYKCGRNSANWLRLHNNITSGPSKQVVCLQRIRHNMLRNSRTYYVHQLPKLYYSWARGGISLNTPPQRLFTICCVYTILSIKTCLGVCIMSGKYEKNFDKILARHANIYFYFEILSFCTIFVKI